MRVAKVSTARNVAVFMTLASDHVTGATGLTLTIAASKDGAAFATITPTVTELASGWYNLALTTTHTNTVGDFVLHITGAAADPADLVIQITGYNPATASMDLSLAKTTNLTGLNDIAATTIVSSGAITTSGGAVSTVTTTATTTNLTNAPTAGDLTATMKTSVTTAATAATPTVTAGTVSDKTGYSLNLAQAITDVQTATVGGALAGAWATAWGKVVKNIGALTLGIWGPGNASGTASKSFTIDDGTNPTQRT